MPCLLLLLLAPPAGPRPLLYLPFDGDACGVRGDLTFEPGRSGAAARVAGLLQVPSAGHWSAEAGTFAAWIRLREPGSAAAPRYLFSLYGGADRPDNWRRNRFSLHAEGGQMRFEVWGAGAETAEVHASMGDWPAETWHHVAVTWQGCTAGDRGARLALFLDGRPAAEAETPPLGMGAVSPQLCLGADADGSRRWLDGLLDDLYVYDVALPGDVIAAAAAAPLAQAGTTMHEPPGAKLHGWFHSGWPFRVLAHLPGTGEVEGDVDVEMATDFVAAAARLSGRPAVLDPASCRVEWREQTIPATVADGRLRWRLPAGLGFERGRNFVVYFRLLDYDLSIPLQARRVAALAPPAELVPPADYATAAYGRPWTFEHDDAGLDNYGDKPEFIRHSLQDGALHLEVRQDPYIIWGRMWGDDAPINRPVDIDLGRYHVLEMRVRQSVPQAEWSVYGRIQGGDELLHHDFPVAGTSWQTVRLDLAAEARWSGHITAFRIDPTNHVEATVDIAWVRLLALDQAASGEVEYLGHPSAPAASLAMDSPPTSEVGAYHEVVLRASDEAGRPVSGQTIRVHLRARSGGRLSAVEGQACDVPAPDRLLGVTDAHGELRIGYQASHRVGQEVDELGASAFFAAGGAWTAITTTPGPPARLVVSPERATPLGPGEVTCPVRVQVADSYGNPLPLAGRQVELSAGEGISLEPSTGQTGPDGSLSATATIDPERCWVAWVSARDAAGLTGKTGGICYTPDRRDWGVTVGDNGYFAGADGHGWLPLGGFYANWVGDVPADGEPGRRLTSFVDTTDAEKVAWLKFLADQGVTALRFMLRAHRPGGMEPMDIGGKVNPELYAEALHYMDLARPFGIRFLLVLHEDYDKPIYCNPRHREQFCLPRWEGVDLHGLPPHQRRFVRDGRLLGRPGERYTDVDAVACQDLYTRELIGLLRENPQVFAYELENEHVAVPPAWVEHQCQVIRSVDPRTPICMSHGGGGLRTADPLYWRRETSIDFYTYHLYPNDTVPDDADYGLATNVLVRYGRMAGRCFLGESVGDEWSAGAPEPMRRRVARDIIWFSLVEGNPGCFFWNARGWEVEEFRLARQLTARIDFGTWAPLPPATLLPVPHPLGDDGWFRSAPGGDAIRRLSRETRAGLRLGANFAYTIEATGTGEPRPGLVRPSSGFEAASWARADLSEGLTYVRNVAGAEVWTTEDAAQRRQLVRTVAPAACRLTLALGPGDVALTIADLDSGQVTERRAPATGDLDLGATSHDLALHWRR